MKVTWLGEDHLHGDQAGPSFTTWGGVKFPKGEAVDVTDAHMLNKAKRNQFFKVEGAKLGRPKVSDVEND